MCWIMAGNIEDDLRAVSAVVDDVEGRVPPRRARLSDIRTAGKRTPRQILESGWTNQFNCLDKVAVIGALLAEKGFEVTLFGARLVHEKSGKPLSMHFFIRASSKNGHIFVNPLVIGAVISKGVYTEWDGTRLVPKNTKIQAKIPENAMEIPAFALAGIKSMGEFRRLAGISRMRLAANFLRGTSCANTVRKKTVRTLRKCGIKIKFRG